MVCRTTRQNDLPLFAATREGRSLERFADIVVTLARASAADLVLCVTESGRMYEAVAQVGPDLRVIPATPSEETFQRLTAAGCDPLNLPLSIVDRFTQAQHALSVALRAGRLEPGEFVAIAIGQGLPGHGGDFLVLMDVRPELGDLSLHDLIKLRSTVTPQVIDAVLQVACRIGRAARRGKRVGALMVVGDTRNVLKRCRQLVLNPLRGHSHRKRNLLNSDLHEMMLELSKLDGAFVIREDGLVETAGAYLSAGDGPLDVPHGLGTRHVAAAAVTVNTHAVAVAVSATDGHVRVFSEGRIVLRMDPEAPHAELK